MRQKWTPVMCRVLCLEKGLEQEKCINPTLLRTPSYKKTILEPKQPVSGINFVFRFSPRLSENDYSQVKFIAKFVPTASNLRYFGLNCCVFLVKSVDTAHNQLTHDP